MKKIIYSALALTALVSAVSCTNNDDFVETPIDPSAKEMISFSMSDESGSSMTRANTRAAFGATTDIVMLFRSNEDGETTNVRANKTMAYTEDHSGMTDHSDINFATDRVRYWDDAYGRKAHLSVYAIGVDQKHNQGNNSKTLDKCIDGPDIAATWSTTTDATPIKTSWKVADNQTSTTLANEDLVYSNNIQTGGKNGLTWYDWANSKWQPSTHTGTATDHGDGCMIFRVKPATPADPSGPGYFDKGHLIFNHALSRLSVTLKEGEGFDGVTNTAADFKFTSGTNITLLNMYTNGELNMKTGKWDTKNQANIASMSPAESKEHANNTFTAQMLPDYVFTDGSTTNVMEFTIDNNTYYITQDMIFDALKANASVNGLAADATSYTMEQGKHYKLTITVKKKQIDAITATIAEWSNIEAKEFAQDNTHIEFTFAKSGSECEDVFFYRLPEDLGQIYTDNSYLTATYSGGTNNGKTKGTIYQGKYSDQATATENKTTHIWSTNWYFENNRTAYHFRSLNTKAMATINHTGANSYFTMQNGTVADADYHWGAIMKNTAYTYDPTNGFESSLHQGITSTKTQIDIQELHMMSNINVVLKTSEGSDAVNLRTGAGTAESPYEYATVSITRLYGNASVDMGKGIVTPTGDLVATQPMTQPTDYFASGVIQTKPYTYAVVPQPLYRGPSDVEANYIGITITTPDHNQYYVVKKLYEIKPTSVGTSNNQTTTNAITRWYPNHNYTYTFTLTKKGIEAITCTVADWINIEATNKDITLED
ncbi:MAG: fimbrillin family protein [Prevotellaceae bacterium]|nr:fimbrillin family protein [Candidatus Minthosoma caballi]